jgi:hypothetical protein
MSSPKEFQSLSDDELLRRLSELLSRSRWVEAELVAHIGEVDERRLYAREACSSMFAYATDVLHLSEHEAYERITAARASRRYPLLLQMLRDGRLHLSGIGKLASHLTEENHEALLARAAHRSKRQIEELLAELSPRPDVPSLIRKLPERPAPTPPARGELGPDRVPALTQQQPAPVLPPAPSVRPVVEPLSPSRYKIQFTASGELRDKLERLQDLMDSDLAAVIEAAVTEKLERLEAKRFAETKSPRKTLKETDTSPKSRYVPAEVRRLVSRRDGKQCRFVNETGRRCPERRGLEFHHEDPFGRGGGHDPDTISLMCKRHNAYFAEREYGQEVMKRYRRNGEGVSETAPPYGTFEPLGVREGSGSFLDRYWPQDGISGIVRGSPR